MSRKGTRAKKVPGNFKDFVSADSQERPMLEEEKWYLVQFEDEGQFYSVLPTEKVHHISPADMGVDIEEGDYVDAEWPADGKSYDAKVVKTGPKAELRILRTTLEKERAAKEKGIKNVNDNRPNTKTDPQTKGALPQKNNRAANKEKGTKNANDNRPKTLTDTQTKGALSQKKTSKDSEVSEDAADKEAKRKKREENKLKRLEMERKRKAELEQAKQNVKYFASEKPPLPTLAYASPKNQLLQLQRPLPSPPKISRSLVTSSLGTFSSGEDSDDEVHEVLDDTMTTPVHRKCPQCATLKQHVVTLEEKVLTLKQNLKEAKKKLQDKESENDKRMEDCQQPAGEMTAGVISPEMAKKSGMVPLVPGSPVFLYQEQKNACFDPKPTILVRNLLRVFFKDEVLKASNYGGGGPRGYTKLDPAVTTAIIGYAMDPQIIKSENRVSQAKLTETINKLCNEARRGISKLQAADQQ